jgi:DNA mismatch endonuclease Vsr
VFPKRRIVVFCDGDFWHGRDWNERKRKLQRGSNGSYWIAKIESNMLRDRRTTAALTDAGWLVLRFWESDITAELARIVETVASAVRTPPGGHRQNARS